jgi:suppressor of ftsI
VIRRLRGPGGDDVRDVDRDIVVGRVGGDIEIDDPEVSRRHAVVRPIPEGVEVEDLGSSNGTFVDGHRIQGKLTITQAAALRVGSTELRIEVELPAATRIRQAPIAERGVTVQRPIARSAETVARPQSAPPPSPPPAETVEPEPSSPAAESPSGRRKLGRPVAIGVAGLLVGALIAAGLVLLLENGNSSAQPQGSPVAARCATKFPPVVNDGFPQPQMRFSNNGVLETSLRMAPADITIGSRSFSTGMLYDKQLPGPILVFCPGDRVEVHLANGLPLSTNLHVHGLHVTPVGNGDNVFIDVKPLSQQTYQYQIPLDHFPGFYWYHPHLHPVVQPQVAGGAAGAIVIEGGLDDLLPNVPQRFIVIQGGSRRTRSKVKPPPSVGKKRPPVGVPNLLVNGVQNPTLRIRPGQIQRWRILNAASERLLDLEMPGVTFQVLAQDGITLRDMLPERRLVISPGSRVEVLVRGGPKGVYTLSALPFHQCHKGCNPFAGPTTGVITPKEDLLTMVSTGAQANDQLPSGPIGDPPDLRGREVDAHRKIVFSQGPATRGVPPFEMNHKIFHHDRVDVTMKLNSVEEWTLTNPTGGKAAEWHTFHIHQNPFQVISRDGKPLPYVDWQDNVTLAPGETIVIRMNPIDFTGKFVMHCHVIFHEDHGMMAVVQVVKNPSRTQLTANRTVYLTPPTTGAAYAAAVASDGAAAVGHAHGSHHGG